MTRALTPKAKGPAEVAASPSHGSNIPPKGKPMNAHSDTTTAGNAAIPVPYPMQDPSGDLAISISMLRVVCELMADDRGFNAAFIADLAVVIHEARENLEKLAIYLSHHEGEQNRHEQYRQARREWTLLRAGVRDHE